MYTVYEKIYIIGQGYTPLACAKLLHDRGIKCAFFEYNQRIQSFSEKRAKLIGIPYFIANKDKINSIFSCKKKTLVLSVNNNFLFPQEWVELEHIDIINYHNSLLPNHRGVHAEAWSIYDGDFTTGITWHVVNSGIDTGDIICQSEIVIDDKMTSLSLLNAQSKLALNTLNIFIDDILQGKCGVINQSGKNQKSLHLKKDIPNNGELCLDWSHEKIWNFLRAMDYGPLHVLGMPRVYLQEKWYGWNKYCKINKNDKSNTKIQLKDNSIIIDGLFLLDRIFEIDNIEYGG